MLISLEHERGHGRGGPHSIIVRCWVDKSDVLEDPHTRKRLYPWRAEVRVPNGGIIERVADKNRTPESFEAPDAGYQPAAILDRPKTMNPWKWQDSAEVEYFIQFADGVYACASVRVGTSRNRPLVFVKSYLNPSGGRYLEFEPSKALPLKRL
ncbi:MAG: hypothetical protein M3463_08915 [Verrucomicrobiota bacterium]|nr:hypothetical protein [Verrucomicrobiota bacterium]